MSSGASATPRMRQPNLAVWRWCVFCLLTDWIREQVLRPADFDTSLASFRAHSAQPGAEQQQFVIVKVSPLEQAVGPLPLINEHRRHAY